MSTGSSHVTFQPTLEFVHYECIVVTGLLLGDVHNAGGILADGWIIIPIIRASKCLVLEFTATDDAMLGFGDFRLPWSRSPSLV